MLHTEQIVETALVYIVQAGSGRCRQRMLGMKLHCSCTGSFPSAPARMYPHEQCALVLEHHHCIGRAMCHLRQYIISMKRARAWPLSCTASQARDPDFGLTHVGVCSLTCLQICPLPDHKLTQTPCLPASVPIHLRSHAHARTHTRTHTHVHLLTPTDPHKHSD